MGKRTRMVCAEEKSVGWINGLFDKRSKPGDFVVNLLSSTSATAKACSELPRHYHFAGCEDDARCVAESAEATSRGQRTCRIMHRR